MKFVSMSSSHCPLLVWCLRSCARSRSSVSCLSSSLAAAASAVVEPSAVMPQPFTTACSTLLTLSGEVPLAFA